MGEFPRENMFIAESRDEKILALKADELSRPCPDLPQPG